MADFCHSKINLQNLSIATNIINYSFGCKPCVIHLQCCRFLRVICNYTANLPVLQPLQIN